jgi:transaldolase
MGIPTAILGGIQSFGDAQVDDLDAPKAASRQSQSKSRAAVAISSMAAAAIKRGIRQFLILSVGR